MIEIKNNEYSKQFFQKIIVFIDSILVNAVSANPDNANKIITNGIVSIRDAILAEVIVDNQSIKINNQLAKPQKKNKKKELEVDQKDLNQEIKSVKNQKV